MEIRPLTENDAGLWWHLRREALAAEPFAFGRSLREHEGTTVRDAEARLRVTAPDNCTLGCFAAGSLIGMATFIRDQEDKQRHKGRIYGVYVSASHQGRGFGKALMKDLIQRATQDSSLEQILITVTAGNEAATLLYEKLGFQFYGKEPAALKIGNEYADMHHMILRVR